jgi:hypothetical protein
MLTLRITVRHHEADSRKIFEAAGIIGSPRRLLGADGRKIFEAGEEARNTNKYHDLESREIPHAAVPEVALSQSSTNLISESLSGSSLTDPELERLRQEMVEIQEHRLTLEQLHALSTREMEIRKPIEEREKNER